MTKDEVENLEHDYINMETTRQTLVGLSESTSLRMKALIDRIKDEAEKEAERKAERKG